MNKQSEKYWRAHRFRKGYDYESPIVVVPAVVIAEPVLDDKAKKVVQLALFYKQVTHPSKLKLEAAQASMATKLQAERNDAERHTLLLAAKAVLSKHLQRMAWLERGEAQRAHFMAERAESKLSELAQLRLRLWRSKWLLSGRS